MPDPIEPPISDKRKAQIESALAILWDNQTNDNAIWWLMEKDQAVRAANSLLLAWEELPLVPVDTGNASV